MRLVIKTEVDMRLNYEHGTKYKKAQINALQNDTILTVEYVTCACLP
jgi:hypothetical protein